jgi:hypothetical protein
VTEDEVLAGVRERVENGTPLDWVLERLAVDPLLDRGNDRRPGVRILEGDGSGAWMERHERGSSAHRAAVARGADLLPQNAEPPASVEVVAHFEAELGHSLPSLLRRLYLEVANGGFGPSYGVLGLDGGHVDDLHRTAADWWRDTPEDRTSDGAPALRVLHRGCAIYNLIDLTTPDARIWVRDPNRDAGEDLYDDGQTLGDLLGSWLNQRQSHG